MSKLSTTELARALYETTLKQEKREVGKSLKNFVAILAKHKMLNRSAEVISKYQSIYDQENRIVTAKVFTKAKLTKDQLESLQNALLKKYKVKEAEIHETIDPGVIGGIRLEVGDEVIDLTVSNRLKQLKHYLLLRR